MLTLAGKPLAVRGNREERLFFCGANVARLDRMLHVSELIGERMAGWRAAGSMKNEGTTI